MTQAQYFGLLAQLWLMVLLFIPKNNVRANAVALISALGFTLLMFFKG